MPHFIAHCSRSVLQQTTQKELLHLIHKAALSSNLFQEKDIKVRLQPFDELMVGGEENTPFFHIFAYIMQGRTEQQKKDLSRRMINTVNLELKEIQVVSMNITDFEKETYFNKTML